MSGASALVHYLHVLRRGAWIIVVCTAIAAASSVFASLRQEALYQASADVFLNSQNLAATLSNVPVPSTDPVREATTQADLARIPDVAERALQAAGLRDRDPDSLLRSSSVRAAPNSNLLNFSVTDRDPDDAARLATAYARAYTLYRRDLDTKAVVDARRELTERLDEFTTPAQRRSTAYTNLVEQSQALRTMEKLLASNALLVRAARDAVQTQPKPVRNGVLGGIFGLLLGLGLAFVADALNTRVRSAGEVQERLGIPLLGRLPEPPRKIRTKDQLVMLADPDAVAAEAFRILATNIEFVNQDRGARSIMISSAGRAEGKSTTAANLAVTLARAGRRVVVVDLDLRLPSLERFFELQNRPGLTHVMLGRLQLEDALVPIPVVDTDHSSPSGNGMIGGLLEALPTGALPPNPSEFARSQALAEILDRLEQRADFVIVDAPPLLGLSDAVALTAAVDAMVVVMKLSAMRTPVLHELERILEAAPVVKLGFALTGARVDEAYGYAYGYDYETATKRRRGAERTRVT
jgi:capsular exopolysaccharide synthesis family protein